MEISRRNDRPSWLLVIFIVGTLILVVLAGIKSIDSLDLPLSKHAETSHEGQLGATEIRNLIDEKECSPVEAYHCPVPGNDHAKVICQLQDDIWAGLIIGLEGNQQVIMTGYPASRSYWLRTIARDRCTPISFGGIP